MHNSFLFYSQKWLVAWLLIDNQIIRFHNNHDQRYGLGVLAHHQPQMWLLCSQPWPPQTKTQPIHPGSPQNLRVSTRYRELHHQCFTLPTLLQSNQTIPLNLIQLPHPPQCLCLSLRRRIWKDQNLRSGQGERRGEKGIQRSSGTRQKGSLWRI